ncbi:SDR family oxidoreductase [Paenibacillus chitinolyticus]
MTSQNRHTNRRSFRNLSKIPMRRLGGIENDIGRMALFLASEDSAYMTGQTVMVDGGATKLR